MRLDEEPSDESGSVKLVEQNPQRLGFYPRLAPSPITVIFLISHPNHFK